MQSAQRFTTEYADREDRVRITHEIVDGSVRVTWLTRRLLDRLLPHLVGWLEKSLQPMPRVEALQAFAQEVAAAKLTVQPPVQATPATDSWLVDSVDLTFADAGLALTFKGRDQSSRLVVSMDAVQLRQWLIILRAQYLKAEWTLTAWPEWLRTQASAPAQASPAVLH